VHTPEFDVERDLDKLRRAVLDLRVDYPVAIVNDNAIWTAFNSRCWARGTAVRFHVRIAGQPPGTVHGNDVDDHGIGMATEPGLYQLVRHPGSVSERTCDNTFLDPGVHAYAVTFG
jgi:hypothetical protein